MKNATKPDELTDSGFKVEEMSAIFGYAKGSYYTDYWKKYKKNKFSLKLNFAALFFSWCWFVYRKMVNIAILGFILQLIITLAVFLPYRNKPVSLLTTLLILVVPNILVGIFGNNIYMVFCEHKILSLRKQNIKDENYFYVLNNEGGTSVTYLVIYLASLFIFRVIITLSKLK